MKLSWFRFSKVNKGFAALGLLASSLFFSWSCSTDVDVNADWEDITIIYSLIDAKDTLHFVRINRAFLGEDDAIALAQVRDSTEYTDIQTNIEVSDPNGNFLFNIPLRDTTVTKEAGIFSEVQKLYYFRNEELDNRHNYKLVVTVNPDTDRSKIVTATTPLIGDIFLNNPSRLQQLRFGDRNDIYSIDLKFLSASNAIKYDVQVEVNVEEIFEDSTVNTTKIIQPIGSIRADIDPGKEVIVSVDGNLIFQMLQDNLTPFVDVPGLVERKMYVWEQVEQNMNLTRENGAVKFIISAASEEFEIYQEVANPSSGLLQDKPEYTNVENGFGLFTTRSRQSFVRVLTDQTLERIIDDERTAALGFCHPNDPNHPKFCP